MNKKVDDLFEFVAKAMAVHNKRLDAEQVHQALKPIFRERERTMITTIFEEKYLEGKAEGEAKVAETNQNLVLAVLRKRFKNVPKQIETPIRQMRDTIALESVIKWTIPSEISSSGSLSMAEASFRPLALPNSNDIQYSSISACLSADKDLILVSYSYGNDWKSRLCCAAL
jgi:hypothetical protein